MIELLSRIFIKNRENYSDPDVRRKYGVLSGGVGIFLNLVLFTIKLIAGGIVMDCDKRTVTCDGQELDLTFKEYELLAYFMENQGVALSRETILNHVWNYDYYGEPRTIDTHVKKLRSKMGAAGDLIVTIRGMGYKLEQG